MSSSARVLFTILLADENLQKLLCERWRHVCTKAAEFLLCLERDGVTKELERDVDAPEVSILCHRCSTALRNAKAKLHCSRLNKGEDIDCRPIGSPYPCPLAKYWHAVIHCLSVLAGIWSMNTPVPLGSKSYSAEYGPRSIFARFVFCRHSTQGFLIT